MSDSCETNIRGWRLRSLTSRDVPDRLFPTMKSGRALSGDTGRIVTEVDRAINSGPIAGPKGDEVITPSAGSRGSSLPAPAASAERHSLLSRRMISTSGLSIRSIAPTLSHRPAFACVWKARTLALFYISIPRRRRSSAIGHPRIHGSDLLIAFLDLREKTADSVCVEMAAVENDVQQCRMYLTHLDEESFGILEAHSDPLDIRFAHIHTLLFGSPAQGYPGHEPGGRIRASATKSS